MSTLTELERGEVTSAKEGPDRRKTVLVVGGITVVALAVRLAAFRGSFFGDELFTYEMATRPGLNDVLAGVRSPVEITPPLFFFIAWAFQKLGDPLVWLRVPSLLAGVATVPLVYVLGIRTVGRRSAAVIGAGLFALSPLATFYATEARAYSLMVLLVVLSTLALLRALDTNDARWWTALAIAIAAALYTHYTCIFVLATQAGWALFTRRDRIRPLLIAHGAALAAFLPWIPSFLDDRNSAYESWIEKLHPFTFTNALNDIGRLADGGPNAALRVVPGNAALALLAISAALAVGGFVLRRARSAERLPSRTMLIALLALATPVGTALYSLVGDSQFLARNLLPSLPAAAIAFGALLVALPRKVGAVALVLTMVAYGIGAASWQDRDVQRPAYAEIGDYLEANARPQDQVLELLLLTSIPRRALRVELPEDMPWFTLREPDKEPDAVGAAEKSGGRIFYVRPDTAGFRDVVPKLVEQHFHAVDQRHWGGAYPMTVIVYEPSK
jgi:hypothetical protein